MVNLISSFAPNQGLLVAIAFDPVLGNVFVYNDFATVIHRYLPNGTIVANTAFTGTPSNDIDLDFAPEAINIRGTNIAANSLLVANGETLPNTISGINKITGAEIGPSATNRALPTTNLVGGAYHATRNTFFAVNYDTDTIQEINLATGTSIRIFPVRPTGVPAFDVNYGDVEVNQATGNIFVVSSSQNTIRELTPTGTFVRDIDVSAFGVSGMSGIAFDDAKGEAYISSTNGRVYRLGGFAATPSGPQLSLSLNYGGISEESPTNFTYTFTRTGSLASPLTANFTVTGTGTFNTDYTQTGASSFTSTTGKVTFAAGASTAQVVINPTSDSIVEANETISLLLTSGTGYQVSTTTAVIATIINDDQTRRQRGTFRNDVLLGTTRNDILSGGSGSDTLTGASNEDIFSFSSPNEGIDQITDFSPSNDLILVSASGFTNAGLIAGDTILRTQFIIGTSATSSTERFIYNKTTGALLFDRDGSGAATAVQFAKLSTNLALTNEDILVG